MDYNAKISLKVMSKKASADQSENYILSPEQIKFYHDNGYIVIKQLIDFNTLYSCKQRFQKICKGSVNKGYIRVIREPELVKKGVTGEEAVNKLQEIAYDDIFTLYIENPKLLHILSQLIGKDIHAIHSMFINKPPGSAEHPPHQDLFYFPIRPADKIIASWTAIDDVTEENGGLFVITGSHKGGKMLRHDDFKDSKKMYYGLNLPSRDQAVSLEMSPGDTVFFHPLLIHGSGPNTTKRFRKSISCHYASSSCVYIEPENMQEALVKDIQAEAKRRGFDEVTYTDVWKAKSKLVRGVRCNL